MKEYSQRTVHDSKNMGKYLTEQSKKGWDVLHIQYGAGFTYPSCWYIILVRDSKQKEITNYE